MAPEIFTEGNGLISSRCLPGEEPEANRGFPANKAFAAAAYVMQDKQKDAIEVLSDNSTLGMPLNLAKLLVAAAVKKTKFSVIFETVFKEPLGNVIKRNYTNFKKG